MEKGNTIENFDSNQLTNQEAEFLAENINLEPGEIRFMNPTKEAELFLISLERKGKITILSRGKDGIPSWEIKLA